MEFSLPASIIEVANVPNLVEKYKLKYTRLSRIQELDMLNLVRIPPLQMQDFGFDQ